MYFFTIIITTYNRPKKLIRAIQSVLDQTYKNFEIIIVNDGSTLDYTEVESFISKFSTQIRYFCKQNEERSIARNFGVIQSKGKFICFLDDDDYYLNNHLQTLYDEILKHNFIPGLYHTYSKILKPNNVLELIPLIQRTTDYNNIEYYLLEGSMTVNCSCISREIMIEFPFNPAIRMAEDTYQRSMAMAEYPAFEIRKYTSVYDKSSDNTSGDGKLSTLYDYIITYQTLFAEKVIKRNVRKRISKQIFFNYYHLIINYHRQEITYYQYFQYSFKMIKFRFTISTLNILLKAFIWKIQRR